MLKSKIILALLFLSLLPFAFNSNFSTEFLADRYSELSVKLWGYQEFFAWDSLFGKRVENVGYPNNLGMLNNPDIFATIFIGILRPFLPEALCYNLLIWLIMLLNLSATFLLSHRWVRDIPSALLSSIIFSWSPVVLSYCIVGTITDVYHLWPYPLAIWFFLQGLEENPRYSILGGISFGLGFILCPYNFVIFTPIAIPLLIWLYTKRQNYQQIWKKLLYLLIPAGILTAIYALKIYEITEAAESHMSSEILEDTRHSWPFFGLEVTQPDRYTTTLSDFFTYGKENVIIRESAVRFYRSFSIPLVVIGLSLFALWKRHWLWGIIAGFFILLSMGPFLALSLEHHTAYPVNIVWLAIFYLWPGTTIILEPFRYALPAFLALSILSAIGLSELKHLWLKYGLIVLCGVELLFVSTAPFPLHQTSAEVADIYYHLDERLPEGGIIEMPYYSQGSYRFVRKHFLNQRVHQRPIPNKIPGFLPVMYGNNPLLHALLELETPYNVQHQRIHHPRQAIQELKDMGFVAIIIDEAEYKEYKISLQVQEILNSYLPAPYREGPILVYRLP